MTLGLPVYVMSVVLSVSAVGVEARMLGPKERVVSLVPVEAESMAAASTSCLIEKAVSIVFGLSAVGEDSRAEATEAEDSRHIFSH